MADYNDKTGQPGARSASGFEAWKPDACACGAPHPSHSYNGREGPWRCLPCHRRADPKRPTVTIVDPHETPKPAPKPDDPGGQGRLI